MVNEAHKICVKSQYDKYDHPRDFLKIDLVLFYDQDNDCLGEGKI